MNGIRSLSVRLKAWIKLCNDTFKYCIYNKSCDIKNNQTNHNQHQMPVFDAFYPFCTFWISVSSELNILINNVHYNDNIIIDYLKIV